VRANTCCDALNDGDGRDYDLSGNTSERTRAFGRKLIWGGRNRGVVATAKHLVGDARHEAQMDCCRIPVTRSSGFNTRLVGNSNGLADPVLGS
jgi:beta-glucosidase-like glycosyl hydrolase